MKTTIPWSDFTYNHWRGCTKVSPGCQYCYAETLSKRNPATLGEWGPGAPRVLGTEAYRRLPLGWNREAEAGRFIQCAECGHREFRKALGPESLVACSECSTPHAPGSSLIARPRVFALSLGDWLDPEVSIDWLLGLLDRVRRTPHLDWQLLTKRPELFHQRLEQAFDVQHQAWGQSNLGQWIGDWINGEEPPPANVWIGTTVEDQARADQRIPLLNDIPAAVRWLSVEPMLERIDILSAGAHPAPHEDEDANPYPASSPIHWVICGGESGAQATARRFDLDWAGDLLQQCEHHGISFFMKQLGTNPRIKGAPLYEHRLQGKGESLADFPTHLQVRNFPRSPVRQSVQQN